MERPVFQPLHRPIMRELMTVLLRHQPTTAPTPAVIALHYDWLMENPRDPDGPLLCWRVMEPTDQWATRRELDLVKIGDHRRIYLEFEGELTGGRGRVHRVDQGTLRVNRWSESGGLLRVRLNDFEGAIELRRHEGERWILRIGTGAA